jgi:hypothetical protein
MSWICCLAASATINSRRRNADGLAVTISPQLDSRVNLAMVCSIPPSSRASIGVNSTPSDGATALDCSELGSSGSYGGISNDCRSRHRGHDLFEQL